MQESTMHETSQKPNTPSAYKCIYNNHYVSEKFKERAITFEYYLTTMDTLTKAFERTEHIGYITDLMSKSHG
jgi:hypothetical protein